MSSLLNRDTRRRSTPRRAPNRPRPKSGLTPEQSKMLVSVAFRVPGVALVLISAVIVVTLVASSSDLTGSFGAIAAFWLGMHQVPLTITGTSLAILPLLPTGLLMYAVARGIARVVTPLTTRRELLSIVGAGLGGPLVVTALTLAMIQDASTVIGLSTPNALQSFAWVLAVHAVAIVIGIGLAVRGTDLGIPDWLRATLRPGILGAAALIAGAALVVALSLIVSWSELETLLDGYGISGALGLAVVSILYLPNVVVGAAAIVSGGTVHFGVASVALFHTEGGPIPPLPVLAALPTGAAQPIWPIMLVVPLAAGVLLGRSVAVRCVDVETAFKSAVTASGGVALASTATGFVAGGALGTFGTVDVTAPIFGLLVFAWLSVVGSSVASFMVWRSVRTESPTPEPRPRPEPVAHPELAVEAELVEEPQAIEAKTDEDAPDAVDAEVVDLDLPEKPPSTDD